MDGTFTPLRVLVADDERIIADTLTLVLKQSGLDAYGVYSGEDAIETAVTLEPDVLITDIVMRGINGIEAAIRICKILHDCRVIVCSGYVSAPNWLRDAKARGHNFELLIKPVSPQVLLDLLAISA